MGVDSLQPRGLFNQRSLALASGARLSIRRFEPRQVLGLGVLVCVLVAQGVAITHSYLLAAPLACSLLVAVAADLPLVPVIGLTLFVRILTDGQASVSSRYSASLYLSALIAVVFILIGAGLLLRRGQGVRAAVLATLWICLWTGIAMYSHGTSIVTVREGVRELSIIALAIIVCNSRGVLSISVVTRLIQVAGVFSALLAIYQLAKHTGQLVDGQIRSNGTFAHPNGAAVFFAIACAASLWRYLELGRKRLDALFGLVFAVATITTFSLTGLAALLAMLMMIGTLRPGSLRFKLGCYAAAAFVVLVFLATPLGAERLASESSTNLGSAQRGAANTSFAWRLYKWGTLIPEWEQAPFLGHGLGTTVTVEGNADNVTAGKVPHNEYLRYLVETGVVGLGILLWAIMLLFRRLSSRRRLRGAPDAGALGIAVITGCLVNAVADNTFLYSNTGYAAALIVAAALAVPVGITRGLPAATGRLRS
jgi:O-antigen ligase